MSNQIPEHRLLSGRLSEDEFYDVAKGFLSESTDLGSVYLADDGGELVFIDPNEGRRLSNDVKDWDETQFMRFFNRAGISSITVRDKIGNLQPGEYSKQSLLRRVGAPKRAKTFPVIQGQKVDQQPRVEGLRLQDALLDIE